MKDILLLVLGFLWFSFLPAFGQEDFRKGFLITLEKDTIHGEIDYSPGSGSFESFRFKSDNKLTEFKPSQVFGFRINEEEFYASQVVENAFVKVLIMGVLNLYKYKEEYYIQKTGGELHKLASPKVEVNVNGERRIKRDTRWKGILSWISEDCKQVGDSFQKLGFNELSLRKFIASYHECLGAQFIDFTVGRPVIKINGGLTAGLVQSFITLKEEMNPFGYLQDRYSSVDPFFGVAILTSFPRLGEKWSLQTEFLLIKSNFSSNIVLEKPFSTEYHAANIDVTSLSIPFSIKYSLHDMKIPLVFLLGISYDNHFKSESSLVSEREFEDNSRNTFESNAMSIREDQVGYLGGIGIQKEFGRYKGTVAIRYIQGHQPYSVKINLKYPNHIPDLMAKLDRLSLSFVLSM